jgi:hypothetical protein
LLRTLAHGGANGGNRRGRTGGRAPPDLQGEAYLLPNVAARGTRHMHWLMTISVVLETALVYECKKWEVFC